MDTTIFDKHGILLRRDAIDLGFDDDWLARMRRAGLIVRLRHGAYASADVWETADRARRHDLTSRAVMQQYDDRVALSHQSNLIRIGGPDWGLDLTTVHVTNLFGRGDRTKAGITHHRGECRAGDLTRIDGHWALTPGRAAVETALLASRDPAVAVLDWVMNVGLATPAELHDLVDRILLEWPGSVDLPHKLGLANGRRESVGETRTGLFLDDHKFTGAEPQWKVFRPDGRLAGVADFALHRERVMIEFDGKIKYGRLLKPGQRIEDVIMAERARERLLEELTGYLIFRIIWADLERPQATAERLRQFIAASALRRAG